MGDLKKKKKSLGKQGNLSLMSDHQNLEILYIEYIQYIEI